MTAPDHPFVPWQAPPSRAAMICKVVECFEPEDKHPPEGASGREAR